MKKMIFKSALLAVASVGLMAGGALAIPVLTLTGSNGGSVVVEDESSLDLLTGTGLENMVSYVGVVDGWDVTTTFGSSLGLDGAPNMHLDGQVSLLSTGNGNSGGTMTYSFMDTFLTPVNVDGWIAGIATNGAAGSEFTYDVLLDGSIIASSGIIGSGIGGWTGATSVLPSGTPYTLELVGTITHVSSTGSSSFDANLQPIPEPATMLLFGAGLVTLAGISRKKGQKKA